MSRADTERLRDILECIEAIDRAEATVRRYPGDPDVAKVAMDAVQRRVFTIGDGPRRHRRRHLIGREARPAATTWRQVWRSRGSSRVGR